MMFTRKWQEINSIYELPSMMVAYFYDIINLIPLRKCKVIDIGLI